MDEIKTNIQGARIGNGNAGKYQLSLVLHNLREVEILRTVLGEHPELNYYYDGTDITFYLLIILPQLNKQIRIPVNASSGTLKWLDIINNGLVDTISLAYFDGKGGLIRQGKAIRLGYRGDSTSEPG